MITVPNLKILQAIRHKELNEIAYVEDEKQYYQYDGNEWKIQESNSSMDLYTVNKQIVTQLPTYNFEQRMDARELIHDITFDDNKKYFMLLCREIGYYTLFVRDQGAKDSMNTVLFECLDSLGAIKSIDLTNDKTALEIWLVINGQAHVFYYFNYDLGVIPCR